MSFRRIAAMVMRHLYMFPRTLERWSESIYWPVLDLVLWGLTTRWVETARGGVSHLALRVSDLREAAEYYRDLLDLDVAFREAETDEGWATLPADAAWDDSPVELEMVMLHRDGFRLAEILPLRMDVKQKLLELTDARLRLAILHKFLGQQGLL